MSESAQVNSYDEVPYQSIPYPQSHPDRLATIASLFGLRPQPIDRCRVLELGCASGGNILPMAERFPGSQFVGVDLSRRQVEMGRAILDQLQLENIELLHKNIMEVTPELGTFHYIICHGVFSWVPEDVQDKILEICSRQLEPNGIGYVSYNTYPGWRMRDMIRDMMCYHALEYQKPEERAAQARTLLAFLAMAAPTDGDVYGAFLRQELEIIRRQADSFLLHEYLEEVNEPTYFRDFIDRAESAGLQYLAETEFHTMSASNFPPNVEATLRQVAQDIIQMEQYMDFVRNRTFRQTLLCHADRQIDRRLLPQYLVGLKVSSSLRPEPGGAKNESSEPLTFFGGQVRLTTSDPLLKTAFRCLSEACPDWVSFEALAQQARARLPRAVDEDPANVQRDGDRLGEVLIQCYGKGAIDLHCADQPFVGRISDYPRVDAVVRLQARMGPMVTNRLHSLVRLDDASRRVAQLLDGRHDEQAIVAALRSMADHDQHFVPSNPQAAGVYGATQEVLSVDARKSLEILASGSLLIA